LPSLSALIGTLMIPTAFLLGRELMSTRTGLIGAVLVALNPIARQDSNLDLRFRRANSVMP